MAFIHATSMVGEEKDLNRYLKAIGDGLGLAVKATILEDGVSHLSLTKSQLVMLRIDDVADARELAPPKARLIGAFKRIVAGVSSFATNHNLLVSLVSRAPGRTATPAYSYALLIHPPLDAIELYDEYMASRSHDVEVRQNTICLSFQQDMAASRV